jgi:hypothetical protein
LDFAILNLFLTITDSRLLISLKKLKFGGPYYAFSAPEPLQNDAILQNWHPYSLNNIYIIWLKHSIVIYGIFSEENAVNSVMA